MDNPGGNPAVPKQMSKEARSLPHWRCLCLSAEGAWIMKLRLNAFYTVKCRFDLFQPKICTLCKSRQLCLSQFNFNKQYFEECSPALYLRDWWAQGKQSHPQPSAAMLTEVDRNNCQSWHIKDLSSISQPWGEKPTCLDVSLKCFVDFPRMPHFSFNNK